MVRRQLQAAVRSHAGMGIRGKVWWAGIGGRWLDAIVRGGSPKPVGRSRQVGEPPMCGVQTGRQKA